MECPSKPRPDRDFHELQQVARIERSEIREAASQRRVVFQGGASGPNPDMSLSSIQATRYALSLLWQKACPQWVKTRKTRIERPFRASSGQYVRSQRSSARRKPS
jgi:hypothetical protein